MLKAIVFSGLSAFILSSSVANAADNCDTYKVVPGDTLRLIAERYYGTRELSPVIFDANSDVIGVNPNAIEIGMELAIPCRVNMQMPQPSAFMAIVAPDSETPQGDNSADESQRFLAKIGEMPFVNQDGSGIIPEILAAALPAGGYEGKFEIARPNTISDLLQASVKPDALLSFPWPLPNCEDTASLSPQSVYMCNNYTYSDPLYEFTLGLFTKAGSPLATAASATSFEGKSICVPQLHSSDLLGQNGISATNAVIVNATDLESCLTGLTSGKFDAVLADYQSYGAFDLSDRQIVDIPAFAQKTTLHAVAYNQNPLGLETLEMVNAGMKKILLSGTWFDIVKRNLSGANN